MSSYVEMQQARSVSLDASWPGLAAGPTVRVDPEALEAFARTLRRELDSGPQVSPEQLEQRLGLGGCAAFGCWDTGQWMEHGLKVAGGSVADYYRRVLEQAAAAAKLFDSTAREYRDSDQAAGADVEAGWDQLAPRAAPAAAPTGPVAESFRESTRVEYVTFVEDVEEYDSEWIEREVTRLRDAQTWRAIAEAGDRLEQVSKRMEGLADVIRQQADILADQWSSDASVACQRALRRIAGTAAEVAVAASRSGEFAFESSGLLQRAVDGGFEDDRGFWSTAGDLVRRGDPNLDRQLREELKILNESYRTVNLRLPPYVNADLPQLPDPRDPEIVGGPSGSSSGYVPPAAPLPAEVPRTPRAAAADPDAAGALAGGDSRASTVPAPGQLGPGSGFAGGGIPGDDPVLPGDDRLVSGGLAGAGSGALPGGVSPGGAGFGPGSGAGAVNGVAPGGSAPGSSGLGVPGPGGVGAMPGGGVGSGRGPAAGAGTGAGRGGMGMVPMGAGQGAGREGAAGRSGGPRLHSAPSGAGGSGSTGTGRAGTAGVAPMTGRPNHPDDGEQQSSWLLEDDDPWRGDDHGLPPPVIK